MTHLDALQLRLSNERQRLANAKAPGEIALRTQWVLQIQREIAAEGGFIEQTKPLTDDELFAELSCGAKFVGMVGMDGERFAHFTNVSL